MICEQSPLFVSLLVYYDYDILPLKSVLRFRRSIDNDFGCVN